MSELNGQRPTADPVVDWSFFSMARYLMTAQPADERVLDGSEWDGFLDLLRTAGKQATEVSPAGPVDRASAFRGLLQMLYFGLERTLGSADPARPVLSRPWPVHLFDYGAGNPDAVYRTVVLRDDLTYRVSGVLGNAPFLSLEFFDGTRQTGSLLRSDLRADADGRFEVTFGPEERPGNWLKVVPGTSYLLTREFFDDWSGAEPSRLEIECFDAPASTWPVMSADRVSKELEAIGQWLVETVRIFGARTSEACASSPTHSRPPRSGRNRTCRPSTTASGTWRRTSASSSRPRSLWVTTGASSSPTRCGTPSTTPTARPASTGPRHTSTPTGS